MPQVFTDPLHVLFPGDIVSPGDEDLIALALARLVGAEDAARMLRTVSASGLLAMTDAELVHTVGMSHEFAERFVAVRGLVELLFRAKPPAASSSAHVLALLPPGLATLESEVVLGLALGTDLGLRGTFLIAKGGMNTVACTKRDILTPLVRIGAERFVLVHNHPSGDPMPSRDDITFTVAVMRAARTLDIELVDHIVVARHGYVSFVDSGRLRAFAGVDSEDGGSAAFVSGLVLRSTDIERTVSFISKVRRARSLALS